MKKYSKLISIFAVCLTFLLSFLLCNKTSVEVNAGNITYEEAKEVSISDLKYNDSLVGDYVTLEQNSVFSYEGTKEYGSIVFKFQYVVSTWERDSDGMQIYFSNTWDTNGMIWIRPDHIYMVYMKDTKEKYEVGDSFEIGTHDIEVGRIASFNDGALMGHKEYVKVDGELACEHFYTDIPKTQYDKNNIFLTSKAGNTLCDVDYVFSDTETLDTSFDEFSISNLTIGGSKNKKTIHDRKDTNATYSKANKYGSFVFKFLYDVNDDSQVESNSFCIYFGVSSDIWNDTNGNSLIIRGDGIYFMVYENREFTFKKVDALEKGFHEFEVGRIAYLKGFGQSSNYKVYLKIDGEEVISSVNPYNAGTVDNRVFFHFGETNTLNNIYDISCDPEKIDAAETYETPDTISIRDLKYNGSKVGQKLTLVTNRSYSYDSKVQNTSVVLKFKYEVPSMPSKGDFSYFQLHFSNTWTEAGFIWIRNDLAVIKNDSDGYVVTREKLFDSVGTHDVEVGKIFITGGVNYGKYYIYLKVDGELALEFTSSNVTASSGIFLVSNNGHTIYDANYGSQGDCVLDESPDRVSIKDLGFNGLTNQIWINNNEHTEVFYYKNSASGSLVFTFKYNIITQYSSDDSGFRINFDVADDIWDSSNALWLRGDHTFVGYTSNLEQKWKQNAALTLGMHDIEFGRIAYLCDDTPTGTYYVYYKVDGELIFSIDCDYDSTKMDNKMFLVFGKQGKENKVYDATYDGKHIHNLEYYPYKDATCFEDGNVEYWGCVDCGSRYIDENGTQDIDFITIVKHHNVTKVEAVESTCFTSGNVEYYICTNCGKKFANEESTIELTEITIPKSHKLEFVEAIEATCTESGNIAYYYCQDCGKCYLDVYGREEVTVVFIKPQHQLMMINAMPATCIIDGNEEYWLCISCHKKFADEDATEEVTEVSIKSNGHQFDENGVCTICGMNQDQNDMIYQLLSQFGCTSSISASGIILLAGIAAFILDRKKKFLV